MAFVARMKVAVGQFHELPPNKYDQATKSGQRLTYEQQSPRLHPRKEALC